MKKTAQIDIKLTGLNSIDKLERELRDVNEQIKLVDVNSREFEVLQQRAQAADAQLRTVQTTLKGVTSTEATDAIKKVGEGLVGAFQVGAGASLIFGEKTGEQFQKVIGKVAGLYSAVDGLDKVSKAFSTENITRLKQLGTQFGLVGNSAKIAGVTMKTALISTGIGALVVGVGLLIAYWDKLTNAIKNNRIEKERAKEKERLEKEIQLQRDLIEVEEEKTNIQKKINDGQGKSRDNAQLDIDLAKKKLDIIEDELKLQGMVTEDAIKKNEEEIILLGKKIAINERNAMQAERLDKKKAAFYRETNRQYQKDIAAIKIDNQLQTAKLELLNQQKKEVEEQARIMQNDMNMQALNDAYSQQIFYLEQTNKLLEAKGYNVGTVYANEKEIIRVKKNQLELQLRLNKITQEEYEKVKTELTTQGSILDTNNIKRLNALKIQLEELAITNKYVTAIKEINSIYPDLNSQLQRSEDILNKRNEIVGNYVDILDLGAN
jgi:hypothetical protein